MIKLIISAIILISNIAFGCGNKEVFEFGAFSTDGINHKHGLNVSKDGSQVIIDTNFIDELIKTPTGRELQYNREELFYLIASGDKKALFAGVKVLSNLIRSPEFITECDSKHELWKKEEVAFVVSRNFDLTEIICKLPEADYDIVVNFYKNHPELWGMIYDPIWVKGNSPNCSFGT